MGGLLDMQPAAAQRSAAARPSGQQRERLQGLVDRAAHFHLYAVPRPGPEAAMRDSTGAAVGIRAVLPIHRFEILQLRPHLDGLRASNTMGQSVGHMELAIQVIAPDSYVRPDAPARTVPLNHTLSQRIVVSHSRLRLAAEDGFDVFGAGRLFPVWESGQSKLLLGAICDLTEGFGIFRRRIGNLTICGELSEQFGFRGHLMVRVLDPELSLLATEKLAPLIPATDPNPDTTFLSWIGQKSDNPEFENSASFTPEGILRGLNIPVALKEVMVDFDTAGGFRSNPIRTGTVIGKEVGFGRESKPRTPNMGTSLTPFQFEGVSEYRFLDSAGITVGTFISNVIEGRSFQVQLPEALGEPALRFGFFGPMIAGTGCFEGVQAMLYGCSGSVFNPPPGIHVISNWYVLRVHDPLGRFRSPRGARGQ